MLKASPDGKVYEQHWTWDNLDLEITYNEDLGDREERYLCGTDNDKSEIVFLVGYWN